MGASTDLTETVRKLYLDRGNGVVEVVHSWGTASLFFRRGELYLDRDHRSAVQISPLLARLTGDSRPAAIPELRDQVEELAREISHLAEVEVELQEDRGA